MTALVVAAPASAQKELPWTEVCRFDDRRLTEISGMAASLMHDNVVWVHNDSSMPPVFTLLISRPATPCRNCVCGGAGP